MRKLILLILLVGATAVSCGDSGDASQSPDSGLDPCANVGCANLNPDGTCTAQCGCCGAPADASKEIDCSLVGCGPSLPDGGCNDPCGCCPLSSDAGSSDATSDVGDAMSEIDCSNVGCAAPLPDGGCDAPCGCC